MNGSAGHVYYIHADGQTARGSKRYDLQLAIVRGSWDNHRIPKLVNWAAIQGTLSHGMQAPNMSIGT